MEKIINQERLDNTYSNQKSWEEEKGYLISLNSSKYLAQMLLHPLPESDLNKLKTYYLRFYKIVSSIMLGFTLVFIILTALLILL